MGDRPGMYGTFGLTDFFSKLFGLLSKSVRHLPRSPRYPLPIPNETAKGINTYIHSCSLSVPVSANRNHCIVVGMLTGFGFIGCRVATKTVPIPHPTIPVLNDAVQGEKGSSSSRLQEDDLVAEGGAPVGLKVIVHGVSIGNRGIHARSSW